MSAAFFNKVGSECGEYEYCEAKMQANFQKYTVYRIRYPMICQDQMPLPPNRHVTEIFPIELSVNVRHLSRNLLERKNSGP